MRIAHRVGKLEAQRSRCDGRVRRIVGPDEPIDDICPRCGGCHVLVIEEVIVVARDLVSNNGGDSRCA